MLEIHDGLFVKIELLARLSGLPVKSVLKEAIWREANQVMPLIQEYIEKDYIDNENKDAVELLRYSAPIRPR